MKERKSAIIGPSPNDRLPPSGQIPAVRGAGLTPRGGGKLCEALVGSETSAEAAARRLLTPGFRAPRGRTGSDRGRPRRISHHGGRFGLRGLSIRTDERTTKQRDTQIS